MFSNSTTTSSSATYRPIPDTDDNEDVTPVSNGFISSIAKRAKKLNLFTISIVVVIILIVTAIVSLGVRRNSAKQVLLFESAPLRGVFLSQVTVGQLKSQGFNIGRLTFDNVQCSSEDHAQNICTPPKRKASRIFIDPKKQYHN